MSRNCQSRLRCKDCGDRHHVSIYDKAVGASQPETPQPPFSQPCHVANREQGEGLHVGSGHQTSTPYVDAKTSVLLQTAQAMVSGTGHDEKSVKARVILDSCSQRSYVSCRQKESLNLLVRTEKLMIRRRSDAKL